VAMRAMPNTHNGMVCMQWKFRGGGWAPAAACATGIMSIISGTYMIESGDAPIAIVGGTESAMCRPLNASFSRQRAIANDFNDCPEKASRPFDTKRCGFVPGEGAGVMILTTPEMAKQLGVTPLAKIVGFGISNDGDDMTLPNSAYQRLAIERALKRGGLIPEDIDHVDSHGTSTPEGDRSETQAIKLSLGKRAYEIGVSAQKGNFGHLLGAAGTVEACGVVKMLLTGWVPQTLNYEFPDPECDLDYMTSGPLQVNPRRVLKNSFGFGGANASIIIENWEA